MQQLQMVWQKFKNLIKGNDLFYSSEMFRYKNEMEYKSLTGGILSIGVIITVLIGFANMIILTMQREIIFSQKEVNKHSQPPIMNLKASPQNNFMMAFQLFGVNLTSPVNYFDYDLVEKLVEGGNLLSQRNIPLVPCTRQHWAQLPQVIAIFDSLGINSWLCPEIGFNLKLYGKYSSPASSEYTFSIKSCVNSSKITCASPQQITQFKKDQDNIFAMSYYFINSIINQNSKDFITYYMQDSQYIMYGKQLGAQAYIYLSDFQISSDYSIWPFQSIETITGSIMESWVSRAFQILPQTEAEGQAQTYAFIRINKSANSIKYNRQVQKISIVFSFIGGMISAVSAVLFVIKAYNGQAFQIEIASALFTDPPQSQQLKNNNFLSYMKFILQNIWKSTKCCKSTSSFLVIQKCLEEMDKQMDVKRLIQRIIFLEHCLTFLFEDYQLESILMKRPTSYQAIKKVRQRCLESQQGIQEDNSSPNNLINLAPIDSSSLAFNSKIRTNPQQNSKEKNKGQKPHIRFEGNLGFDDDIPLENSQYHLKKKTFVKSKKQILSTLQINAKKGDRISEKIYIHLYQKGSDAVQKQQ